MSREEARVISLALNTPYADLVPAMSAEDLAALNADLVRRGQTDPILIDEDRNILDGHNRYASLGASAKTQVVTGLPEAEKKAFVVMRAMARRNMTAEQKRVVRETQKRIAFELRQEDAKLNTQERIAEMLGVSQQTVSDWFAVFPNTGPGNKKPALPDARRKHTAEVRDEAVRRVEAGETGKSVAVALGVSPSAVSKWRHGQHRAEAMIETATDPLPEPEAEKPSRRRLPPRIDHEARGAAVRELHEQGLGTTKIAERLGLGMGTVSQTKTRLGIAENSPCVKLMADLDRACTVLAGAALALDSLAIQVEGADLSSREQEIRECVKSLSESRLTVTRLHRALKSKCR